MEAVSRSRPHAPGGHLPGLDGLRGLAVLAVVVHHSVPWIGLTLDPGPAAVRLFFVLSGFLITGILLRARAEAEARQGSRGTVVAGFYGRRFLRIFPIYYACLLLVGLLDLDGVRPSLGWYLSYLTNFHIAQEGRWLPLGHLWSLAVEEQFYLLWPFLVLFLPRRLLGPVIVGLVVVAPLQRAWFAWVDGQALRTVILPGCCLDSLGLGALLALVGREGEPGAEDRLARLGLLLGLPLLLGALATRHVPDSLVLRSASKFLAYALLSVWLVHRAARGGRGGVWRLLSWKPLVALGAISYGVYLLHEIVPAAVHELLVAGGFAWVPEPAPGLPRLGYVLAVTLPVATLSWHFFEKPLNNLKRWIPYVPAGAPARLGPGPAQAAAAPSPAA